ncbi:ribosomal protein S18 acetylase RimI-like enzyme [Kineosphaera limosa]|uniref:N-acetyltransferase domain-containing protein n=1 Tax=Kineosphaera limosa NBRC 100340 TaxID=1184609 RepID=K6WCM0_9MICO|nr:hypothetical protein [Kineosphaera limosa]NYE00382.1 ribosomal protein S18 acetylase RimI-like enzyme [Kineosphaera limosa]GAB97020.1 hypothetical protein KILIM_054_00300 [Kineosphaera limosa NBRC 100340]
MSPLQIDIIGYVASALIVLSLSMTSIVRLRIVSTLGALTMTTYGVLLHAIPVIITNIAVLGLNLWFLRKEFSGDKDLRAVRIEPDSPFLRDFLLVHAADVEKTWSTSVTGPPGNFAVFVTREGVPTGLLVGEQEGDVLRMRFDYVLAEYRDSGIGPWLFSRGAGIFRQAGIKRITVAANSQQDHYLSLVGFRREGDDFVIDL